MLHKVQCCKFHPKANIPLKHHLNPSSRSVWSQSSPVPAMPWAPSQATPDSAPRPPRQLRRTRQRRTSRAWRPPPRPRELLDLGLELGDLLWILIYRDFWRMDQNGSEWIRMDEHLRWNPPILWGCEKSHEDDAGCKSQVRLNEIYWDLIYFATQDGNWDMAKTASGVGACLEDRWRASSWSSSE